MRYSSEFHGCFEGEGEGEGCYKQKTPNSNYIYLRGLEEFGASGAKRIVFRIG